MSPINWCYKQIYIVSNSGFIWPINIGADWFWGKRSLIWHLTFLYHFLISTSTSTGSVRLPRPVARKVILYTLTTFFSIHTFSAPPSTSTSWWSCHRTRWQGGLGWLGRRQHSWHTARVVNWQSRIPSACPIMSLWSGLGGERRALRD